MHAPRKKCPAESKSIFGGAQLEKNQRSVIFNIDIFVLSNKTIFFHIKEMQSVFFSLFLSLVHAQECRAQIVHGSGPG